MFKSLAFILISAVVILVGLWVVTTIPYAYQGGQLPFEVNYQERVKTENNGVPALLHISSLFVYADIEQVDLDENGRMNIPTSDIHLAWYSKSAKLGEKGTSVIAGYFDTKDGKPNNFYHLAGLKKGDTIEVDDMNGKRYSYKITDVGEFDWNMAKTESLLLKSFSPRLDLIMYPTQNENNRNVMGNKTVIYAVMR